MGPPGTFGRGTKVFCWNLPTSFTAQ